MDSFIFNGNDPNSKAHRERVIQALMNPPKNVGEGLASIGQAFAYRQQQNNPYPKAPGNSPFTGVGRIMGMFNRRGLY